jgi:F-type H+-transporting ATPase subunit b
VKQNQQKSKFSLRLLRFALPGVLGLTSALWPFQVRALQDVPSQPYVESPKQEAKNPPHTAEQKTAENENDEYRHAPVVQSLARIMHMDVERAAQIFEIFNVSIVVLGIVIPLVRIMPRLLRGRSQKIQANIEEARRTTEDANKRLSAVEAKMASLDVEIAKFRTEVEQQIVQDEQRGKAALEEESARIVASAEQEIGVAAAQAKRSLRNFAADLAIEQAARQLVLTPDTDRALIAEFVREAGRANGGGKN